MLSAYRSDKAAHSLQHHRLRIAAYPTFVPRRVLGRWKPSRSRREAEFYASVGPRETMDLQVRFREQLIGEGIGEEIFALAAKIYPICRSITGDGVRQTLREIGRHIDLEVHEVPTGIPVLDWTIPREWNIRDAYVKDARGEDRRLCPVKPACDELQRPGAEAGVVG